MLAGGLRPLGILLSNWSGPDVCTVPGKTEPITWHLNFSVVNSVVHKKLGLWPVEWLGPPRAGTTGKWLTTAGDEHRMIWGPGEEPWGSLRKRGTADNGKISKGQPGTWEMSAKSTKSCLQPKGKSFRSQGGKWLSYLKQPGVWQSSGPCLEWRLEQGLTGLRIWSNLAAVAVFNPLS